jgi:hypothetical protein
MGSEEESFPVEGPGGRRREGIVNKMRRRFMGRHSRTESDSVRISDIVVISLSLGLLLLGTLVGFTLYQQIEINDQQAQIKANQDDLREQQKQLEEIEERDRNNSYQTAYRFCSRDAVDRASSHWFIIDQMPKDVLELAKQLSNNREIASSSNVRKLVRETSSEYRKMLEARDGLPILDCKPNINGLPASYMQPRDQRKFVRRWLEGKLTPAEVGICSTRIGKSVPGDC